MLHVSFCTVVLLLINSVLLFKETTEDPQVEGSRSYQSSVTPRFGGTKAPKTLVLLCFGAIREGRMIRDRSLLTS